MIKIAAGGKLKIKQDSVRIDGHAIEARVYAEDPLKGFLPSVGHLLTYKEPEGVRVDSGVVEGDEIPVFYDPIISKVVAYG